MKFSMCNWSEQGQFTTFTVAAEKEFGMKTTAGQPYPKWIRFRQNLKNARLLRQEARLISSRPDRYVSAVGSSHEGFVGADVEF